VGHEVDASAMRREIVANVVARPAYGTRIGCQEARKQPQKARLPGTVRALEEQDVAGFQAEAQLGKDEPPAPPTRQPVGCEQERDPRSALRSPILDDDAVVRQALERHQLHLGAQAGH
jgi:hypothetical protein